MSVIPDDPVGVAIATVLVGTIVVVSAMDIALVTETVEVVVVGGKDEGAATWVY